MAAYRAYSYPKSINICDIIFKKTKDRREAVDRMGVYAETVVQTALQKKYYKQFRRIHKKTSLPESLF